MPFNARREALIIGFAYHSLLRLDKVVKRRSAQVEANQRKKIKEEKDCL